MSNGKKPSTAGSTEYRVVFEHLEARHPEAWAWDWFGPYTVKADADRRALALRQDGVNYRNVTLESRTTGAWS